MYKISNFSSAKVSPRFLILPQDLTYAEALNKLSRLNILLLLAYTNGIELYLYQPYKHWSLTDWRFEVVTFLLATRTRGQYVLYATALKREAFCVSTLFLLSFNLSRIFA
jgi:hypothetical protein